MENKIISKEQANTEKFLLNIEQEVPFFMDSKSVFIAKIFKKNKIKSILDLGCGDGELSIAIAKKGFELSFEFAFVLNL